MDRMKRFIECGVPVTACNMRCEYCYVTQNHWWDAKKPDFRFAAKVKDAFTQERLGGVCMINMCAAGETLLEPEVLGIIRDFLENGHYVMVVTNGTLTKRFQECCNFPEEFRKRLFFKISFHFLELKRIKMMDTFFDNIRMLHQAGISFTVELTPDDSYIPYIPEIQAVCQANLGALCHVTICRDERRDGYPLMSSLSMEEFVRTWESFDSDLFQYKESIFEVKRKEFCYAGLWSITVNLKSGRYSQCYKGKTLGNIYDLSKPVNFLPIGHHCREGHCFNGHAFLGFGVIPGLDTTDYADMRNRVAENGEQWLGKDMEQFMRCKLKNANPQISRNEKMIADIKSISLISGAKNLLGIR